MLSTDIFYPLLHDLTSFYCEENWFDFMTKLCNGKYGTRHRKEWLEDTSLYHHELLITLPQKLCSQQPSPWDSSPPFHLMESFPLELSSITRRFVEKIIWESFPENLPIMSKEVSMILFFPFIKLNYLLNNKYYKL